MPKLPSIRPPRPLEQQFSLVEDLAACADDIRQLHTEFGGRAYRVFLVWVQYQQDENDDGIVDADEAFIDDATIGAGRAKVIAEHELLPLPAVSPLDAVRMELEATGNTERGGVVLTQVSAGYTEDFLRGLLPELRDESTDEETLVPGIRFFYEIRQVREPGHVNEGTAMSSVGPMDRPVYRRRFVLASLPAWDPYGFEWTINLVRADGDRTREGCVL